jgi:hypothetical protein
VSLRKALYDEVNVEAIPRLLRQPIYEAWETNASAGRVLGTVELVDCVWGSDSPGAMEG